MRAMRRWGQVTMMGAFAVALVLVGSSVVFAAEPGEPAPTQEAAAESEPVAPPTLPAAAESEPVAPPTPPAAADPGPTVFPEYAVRVGDTIRLSVWGEPRLTTEAVVMPDGTVSLPMIGVQSVVGKTISTVTEEVEQAYGRYFKDPKVSLTCLPKTSSQVYIGGAVARPGPLDHDPRLRLMDYLAIAGGPTVGADLTRVVLTSVASGTTMSTTLDLSRAESGQQTAQNPLLMPGDTVWVGRALPVAVVGAVARPGSFDYQQGLRLSDYLGMAGGPTDHANLTETRLKHAGAEASQAVDAARALTQPDSPEANPTLRPGDVVTVPTRFVGGTLDWSDVLSALASVVVFWGRR